MLNKEKHSKIFVKCFELDKNKLKKNIKYNLRIFQKSFKILIN